MSSASDVRARWSAKRDEFRRMNAQVDGAKLLDDLLRELEALDADEQLLTITAAAARSGYSSDHLSRLVRNGALPNYGKKGRPLVKLSECPRKPKLATGTRQAYDPDADARRLQVRR